LFLGAFLSAFLGAFLGAWKILSISTVFLLNRLASPGEPLYTRGRSCDSGFLHTSLMILVAVKGAAQ
jgi:hypothetical protein